MYDSSIGADPFGQGAIVMSGGVYFSIYSEHASSIVVEIYKDKSDRNPERYTLSRGRKFIWSAFVSGIRPGALYGYRIDGPFQPTQGLRYNKNKLLIDPYAHAVSSPVISTELTNGYKPDDPDADLSFDERDDSEFMAKSVVCEDDFDWKGVTKPNIPWEDTIIYETHVKGFTKLRQDLDESIRGTYSAFCSDQIVGYLKDLGITTVELLPVHQRIDSYRFNGIETGTYWGYNTVNYFSPEIVYSRDDIPGYQVNDFKNLVKKLHENNIEVILDVVYNHTAEGNQLGPTMSFRGIDNEVYYKLANDKRYYMDFTGVGNSINIRHPQVLKMITDSLRYWTTEMQVDGFRFDLATVLGRKRSSFDQSTSFFDIIHSDPVLSRVKLIAEPWDVGTGGYQLGNFPVDWSEWNGKFRDAARHYWKGRGRNLAEFATRFDGSPDMFEGRGRNQYASINFITCHDGFTLNDLVTYNTKHNDKNAEENRDGTDNNISDNFGFEGITKDEEILRKRNARIRSFMITLLTSQGVPMILGGDEIKRSQDGNNNAYRQDDAISWYDWNLDADKQNMLNFTKKVIKIRKSFCVLRRTDFPRGSGEGMDCKQIAWLKSDGSEMAQRDWHVKRAVGVLLPYTKCDRDGCDKDDLLILYNPSIIPLKFKLPGEYNHFNVLISSNETIPEDEKPTSTPEIILESGSSYVLRGIK